MNSRTRTSAAKTRVKGHGAETEVMNELWERYRDARNVEARNALIENYVPIVKHEARKVATALSNAVTAQELESAGTLGLIDSIDNFDPGQGFKFVTFCTPRVRGAMFDELRSWDWMPRATRAKLNKLERAIAELENRLGHSPDEAEIGEAMGLSPDDVRRLFTDKSRSLVSLDAPVGHWNDSSREESAASILEDRREADPMGQMQKKEIAEAVRKILSNTERLVITLYYYEQLNLREIGHVLGLTESRICQIHSKIMGRLKKQFA